MYNINIKNQVKIKDIKIYFFIFQKPLNNILKIKNLMKVPYKKSLCKIKNNC